MRVLILGFGEVAKSLTRILLKEKVVSIDEIFIVDCDEEKINDFINIGGHKSNTKNLKITKENLQVLFDSFSNINLFIALCDNVDYPLLLEESIKRKIHFLSACDDIFACDRKKEIAENVVNIKKYLKIKEKYKGNNNLTSIIEFGMNPGLVSVFVKNALCNIVKNDNSEYVKNNREELKKIIKENNYSKLVYLLKVTDIVISDIDNQEFNVPYDENKKYSTWNVTGMFEEFLSEATEVVGSFEDITKRKYNYFDNETGYMIYDDPAIKVVKKGMSKNGIFDGYLVNHEELLTLSNYFSYKNEKVNYRPNIRFVYRPNEYAIKTGLQMYINIDKHLKDCLLTYKQIARYGEEVGVYIKGDNFKSNYVGNYVDIKDIKNESPTIIQVTASLFSAIKYIMLHKNEGVLFPEELDVDEIMNYIKKYLFDISEKEV